MNSYRWVLFKSQVVHYEYLLNSSLIRHYPLIRSLQLYIMLFLLPFSDLLGLVLPSNSPTVSVAPPFTASQTCPVALIIHRTIQVLQSLINSWWVESGVLDGDTKCAVLTWGSSRTIMRSTVLQSIACMCLWFGLYVQFSQMLLMMKFT